MLDASDSAYAQFGVWQDANSDGVSQAGEFRLLSGAGIAGISLTGDGQAYSAAGGDVEVFGQATYTRTDGSTGTLADATFAIAERLNARSGELVTASAAASGLLAAMALEHANPAAADGLARAGLAVEIHAQPASFETLPDQASDTGQAMADQGLTLAEAASAQSGHAGEPAEAANWRAGLEQLGDRFADLRGEFANDGAKNALFGQGDHAMDALLSHGAVTQGAGFAANPALAAALTDSAGAQVVDSIVDHFAGASAGVPEQLGQGEAFGFESLLQLGVSGGGSDLGAATFGAMHMIDHDEQAAAMA
jgi:hypothetical protein